MPIALKMIAAAAAMSSVLVVLAGRGAEPLQKPADALADRWPHEERPAPKGDRLALAAPPPTLPAAVELPAAKVRAADISRPRAERPRRARNVCTRHGMRKVVTRGGRSWRCR